MRFTSLAPVVLLAAACGPRAYELPPAPTAGLTLPPRRVLETPALTWSISLTTPDQAVHTLPPTAGPLPVRSAHWRCASGGVRGVHKVEEELIVRCALGEELTTVDFVATCRPGAFATTEGHLAEPGGENVLRLVCGDPHPAASPPPRPHGPPARPGAPPADPGSSEHHDE